MGHNLRYADDTVVIADSPEALQRLINKICTKGEQLSLKIAVSIIVRVRLLCAVVIWCRNVDT